jgi:hypothetical protein
MIYMMAEQAHDLPKGVSEDPLKENGAMDIEYEKVRALFDDACLEIARRYNLYYKDGKPRRAKIIEIVARTTCIDKELKKNMTDRVDDLYKECHQQACNILFEELHDRFRSMGLKVSVSTEKITEYCKADILILPNCHGVSLVSDRKQVAIEIKTGYSLSIVQLYRYLLDEPNRDLILWRIRNRQVLVFEGPSLRPLLIQFMRMFVLRTNRFLASAETSCEHRSDYTYWSPDQQRLQEAFSGFAHSVVDTLPSFSSPHTYLETVLRCMPVFSAICARITSNGFSDTNRKFRKGPNKGRASLLQRRTSLNLERGESRLPQQEEAQQNRIPERNVYEVHIPWRTNRKRDYQILL